MPFMDMFKNLDVRELENAAPATSGADYMTPSKAKGAYMAKITALKDKVIRDFYQRGTGLNESIANIATQEGLNHDQLSRLIEEVNCDVYLEEYAKTKNSSVRDVKFEIASMTKVKDLMNPQDSQDLEKTQDDPKLKQIKGGNKGMMKRAFTEDFEGDALNAFNYTAFETCGLAPEADKDIDPNIFTQKKIERAMEELDKDIDKLANELYEDYSALANTLIKTAQHNGDAQGLFETMCKEAQFERNFQEAVVDLFTEKVANYKELGYIAPSADITLSVLEDITPDQDFSLGAYSLQKRASEAVPTVVTNKGMIKDVSSLINLANRIETKQKKIEEKQQKRKSANIK